MSPCNENEARRPAFSYGHKWTKGDFELVSNDGISFRVPTYQLQAASAVLRNMIEACTGEKRLEIDEKSDTINDFLLLTTGDVLFLLPLGCHRRYEPVVELVRFLKKYECAVPMRHLVLFVRAPSDTEFHHYVRLLLATHLDLSCDIANMIADEPKIFECLRHSEVEDPDLNHHPRPHHFFHLLPAQYLWALMVANVFNRKAAPVGVAPNELLSPQGRFLVLLSHAQTGKPE